MRRRGFGVSELTDLQLRKLLKGHEVEAGLGEEAGEQAWPVLHTPEPAPGQRRELDDVAPSQVGQGPLEVRPDRLSRGCCPP